MIREQWRRSVAANDMADHGALVQWPPVPYHALERLHLCPGTELVGLVEQRYLCLALDDKTQGCQEHLWIKTVMLEEREAQAQECRR